jgi:hypothetical protein
MSDGSLAWLRRIGGALLSGLRRIAATLWTALCWIGPTPWIVLGAVLVLLPGLWTPGLLEPWERTHAGIAQRLAEDGPASAFTPVDDDEVYVDRPAAAYWPGALAVRLFQGLTFGPRLPLWIAGLVLACAALVVVPRVPGTRRWALAGGVALTLLLAVVMLRPGMPSTVDARLASAVAGVSLAVAAFVFVRRVRGTAAGALVAGVVTTTPLAAILFRSALPSAFAVAASSAAFLALAAAALDASAPRTVHLAGWALLGLAFGLGGVPAVVPPLAALGLFALLGGRRPAFGNLRLLAGAAVALAVAAPLVVPPPALHGPAALRGFVRPDIAEEGVIDEPGEKEADQPRKPDDRNGWDVDLEAVAWGAFPWSAFLPAALLGLAWRRRTEATAPSDGAGEGPGRAADAAEGGQATAAGAEEPGEEAASAAPVGGVAAGADDGRDFDFLCLLWALSAFATTAILGDRWHHDPYGAIVPLGVVVGLYLARKIRGEWSFADGALLAAGAGLLFVVWHDLEGGGNLARAATYFAGDRPAPLRSLLSPLRVAFGGGLAAIVVAVAARASRRWIAAGAAVLALAAALVWTLAAIHALVPHLG